MSKDRLERKRLIDIRIKYVKSLRKELHQIYAAHRNLGYVYLKKPIRDGWFKSLTLRSDLLHYKNVRVYKEVLNAVLVETWGREKKFADKVWKSRFEKLYPTYQREGVKFLDKVEFEKLSTKAKRCFEKVDLGKYFISREMYFCKLPRYYFVSTYRRAYIYRWKVISPELQRRADEIIAELASSKLYKLDSVGNSRYYFRKDPVRRTRKQVNSACQTLDIESLEKLSNRNLRLY